MGVKLILFLSCFTLMVQGDFGTWNFGSIQDKVDQTISSDQDKAICLIAGAAILGLTAYICSQNSNMPVPSSHELLSPMPAIQANSWEPLQFTSPFINRVVGDKLPKIVHLHFKECDDLTVAAPFYNNNFRTRGNPGFHPIFPVLFKRSRVGKPDYLYSFSGNTDFAGIKELGSASKVEVFFDRNLAELRVFYSNYRENKLKIDRIESYRVGENNNFSQLVE
jgi:hypothetical protein